MLDEPSLGLAPLVVREVLNAVAGLWDHGLSVLLIEQNVRAALEISDYGYVLENGKVRSEVPAAALRNEHLIAQAHLGDDSGALSLSTQGATV